MIANEIATAIRSEFDTLRDYFDKKERSRTWLSVKETARHIGLSESQVRALIRDNILPAHKIKGALRLNVKEVDATIIVGRNVSKRRLNKQEKLRIGDLA